MTQQKNNSDTSQRHPTKEYDIKPVRTIMLIGRTGSGKSALANVITGTNEYDEDPSCTSGTRNYRIQDHLIDGKLYRIVDTVGIGDTKLSERDVLYNLAEAADSIKHGLHQILFVINGRFTEAETKAYDLLRAVIFDKEVIEFTTIVRTYFPEFEDLETCETDREKMIEENGKLSEIIQRCKKVIYVNNPPLAGRPKEIELNKEIREDSRNKILTHLSICKDMYTPSHLRNTKENVGNYMTENERLQKEVIDLQEHQTFHWLKSLSHDFITSEK
nr:13103_t:CDS:2 [Entrophospora candida]